MEPKVLVYTFFAFNNITFKIVRQLPIENIKKIYINGLQSLQRLATHIIRKKYDYILGLGDCPGNKPGIMNETVFGYKYGKRAIIPEAPEYYCATWELPQITLSSTPTTGPCNRSAYFLSHTIAKNNLQTRLAFLHVPRNYPLDVSIDVIKKIIGTM